MPSVSEGEQPAANPSVKHRQGEAVAANASRAPLDLDAGRPAVCQRSSKPQVVRKLAPVIVTGACSHGQSPSLGRMDYCGGYWAQRWARDPLRLADRLAPPPGAVAAPGNSASVGTRAAIRERLPR